MCKVYWFLNAVKGNWRNAMFIKCESCPYGRNVCDGFLLTTGHDGAPILISAAAIRQLSGQSADRHECLAVIDRKSFEKLFAVWLEWNVGSSDECSVLQTAGKHAGGSKETADCSCISNIVQPVSCRLLGGENEKQRNDISSFE
jgi:hypothetical protein